MGALAFLSGPIRARCRLQRVPYEVRRVQRVPYKRTSFADTLSVRKLTSRFDFEFVSTHSMSALPPRATERVNDFETVQFGI
jgi:hypothetical protein